MRLAIACLAILAVVSACNRDTEQQACRLTREIAVATTVGSPSALAAGRGNDGRFAVAWSADGQSSLAWLDPDGDAIESTMPLEKTTGGERNVAAQRMTVAPFGRDRMAVAVVEAPTAGRAGGTYLGLVGRTKGPIRLVNLGPAGPFASGIAVAEANGRIVAIWYDGTETGALLRLASVDPESGSVMAVNAVDAGAPVSGVALAASGDTLFMAAAMGRSEKRAPRFGVHVAAVSPDLELKSFVRVAGSRFVDPAPALAAIGSGFALAYRDETDGDRLAESFLARLDRTGRLEGRPVPVSRADGAEGPQVVACGPELIVASVRSFERSLIVGSNRLDSHGAKLGGEFQVYADKSDFTRVALAPMGTGVLMAYVEDGADGGRVLASRVVCEPR
ncbi:MAG: hypothetical protein PHU25_05300 [Deltaproteobacteria bacterium]|nr:hypothetical protein [Deltaproteobacteria bacterium]